MAEELTRNLQQAADSITDGDIEAAFNALEALAVPSTDAMIASTDTTNVVDALNPALNFVLDPTAVGVSAMDNPGNASGADTPSPASTPAPIPQVDNIDDLPDEETLMRGMIDEISKIPEKLPSAADIWMRNFSNVGPKPVNVSYADIGNSLRGFSDEPYVPRPRPKNQYDGIGSTRTHAYTHANTHTHSRARTFNYVDDDDDDIDVAEIVANLTDKIDSIQDECKCANQVLDEMMDKVIVLEDECCGGINLVSDEVDKITMNGNLTISKLSDLFETVSSMNTMMKEMKASMAEMKASMAEMKASIDEIKAQKSK